MNTNLNNEPGDRMQLDLLISRIADGEAAERDWEAFNGLASTHPAAWRELAQAQHDHAALSLGVGVALHAAERVDLPTGRSVLHESHGQRITIRRVAQWGGWAVAACVALAWSGALKLNTLPPGGPQSPKVNAAGWYTVNSPEQALDAYKKLGEQDKRVIGELPQRVLLSSEPLDTGNGFEVVFIRQLVERAQVRDMMRFGQDEAGNPVPIRVVVPSRPGNPQ